MIGGWCLALRRSVIFVVFCLLTATTQAVGLLEKSIPYSTDIAIGDDMPTGEQQWSKAKLPDDWSQTKPGFRGTTWYRLRFDLTAIPNEPLVIYVSRVAMYAQIMVNGKWVKHQSASNLALPHLWNTPVCELIPEAFLNFGGNTLLLKVSSNNRSMAGLSEVNILKNSELGQIFDTDFFLKRTAVQISTAVALLMTLYSFIYWRGIANNRAFGFFSAALAVWAFRNVNYFLDVLPTSGEGWIAGSVLIHLVFIYLVTRFIYSLYEIECHVCERVLRYLLVFTLLITLSRVFFEWPVFWINKCGWLAVPAVFWLMFVTIKQALIKPSASKNLMAATMVFYFFSVIYDELIVARYLPFDSTFIDHFASIFMFVAVTSILAQRQVLERNELELSRRALIDTVSQKETELSASYDRLRVVEIAATRQSTLQAERKRLMQDMHDGVGSQLVAGIDSLRRGAISSPAVEQLMIHVLDDLRMIIDSLEPHDSDFLIPLGNFRYRIEPRLQAAGITLHWSAKTLPTPASIDPTKTLQLLRIVQEVFANIIKHARAADIWLSIEFDELTKQIELNIRDNGVGFDTDAEAAGRGLRNLHHRAGAINARLSVSSSERGTSLRFLIPV
jgi:signal transduction histidine kinase